MVAPETVASRPTVSVIVPARNEEACLGACLESLAAQTGVGFEIILVNDASTDRTREMYDAIGGHGAVSDCLLEDVAVAKAVKASGRKIFFRFGGDAVRTRMYRSFAQLREGWTKNLALLFPSPFRLALLRLTEFLL